MFEKLILNNFQSHKETEINFSSGVNTIIGTSDHGKSSIFRALNLICNNKPEGSHFVSHWLTDEKGKIKGNTNCTLYVDGNKIQRIKGKTNEYKLNGESLKAFQRDVPEQITKVLNLDEANIQHQSDNFFLLNIPSTKVAEELNKIVNLEIIDESVNKVNAKLREAKADYKTQKELIEDYQNKLKNFDGINYCLQEIDKIIYIEKQIKNIITKHTHLSNLILQIKKVKEFILKYNQLSKLEKDLFSLTSIIKETDLIKEKATALEKIKQQITITFRHLAKCRCLVRLKEDVNYIENLSKKINQLDYVNTISSIIQEVETVNNDINKYDSKLKKMNEQYKNLMPDICPLCNRPIDHEIHTHSRQPLSV